MTSLETIYRDIALQTILDDRARKKREQAKRQSMDTGYRQRTPGYAEYATGAINDLAPSPLDAMAMSQIPGLADAAGFAADARRMYDNPEERTWGNMGLAAAGALPFVPSGLAEPVAKAVKKLAPGDARMATAQRNAALPVSEGGLGLPPDNTAMQRAEAMGYLSAYDVNVDSPSKYWLHGTPAGDLEALGGGGTINRSSNNSVGSVFTTNDPAEAAFYAKGGHSFGGSIQDAVDSGKSPTIYPLLIRGRYKHNPAKNKYVGDDAVANYTTIGSEKEWAVAGQPNQVRSPFAAFDPMRRHEADLLGRADPRLLAALGLSGLAAAAAPGAYSWMQERDKQREEKR